ncbi:MAG: tRNA lysidine(34) synthetase TilS [Butyricicoccus sp.]|nr:tRNA lysidine(34) synthetase TilS [Butyricicoccus sp.]
MDIDGLRRFAKKYDMLPDGARILCAVSGGADSVCLLHLLKSGGADVVCAHFNHRLRGAESDRDERFVRALCEKLGVECLTGAGDVARRAAENSIGTEEAARALRYEFLFESAEKCGADRIATAHNAEDNAETVIMNLARGAGLRGLGGIPPRRGKIIRPLLQTTREEIIAYLAENGLGHVEDSTNAADAFARNRLRHHVLPVLRQQNEAAVLNIARAAELFRADEEYFREAARHFMCWQALIY